MTDATQLWTTCAAIIRSQVSDVVWQTTFNHVEPVAVTEHELVLAVPNALAKERVDHRYRGLVHDALAELGQAMLDVRVEVRTAPAPLEPTQQQLELGTSAPAAPVVTEARPPDPPKAAPTAESVNSRYTFDDFVTGTSNRFAHAAALAVAETPARSYNPLFIYGDAGLGKTHLLQAIANYVHDHYPTYKVRYVSTETFLNRFVDAIRNNTLPEFKRRYREIDVLLVDDIQFMEGKEGLQEEFFHTFNSLHQANRQIVLSSDRPPDSIPTLEDRLRSRFKMGLITDIQPPDLETRLAILRKKGDNESIPIPPEVLEFIASNVTDNIRELEGALIRVSAYASLNHLPCTVELAERVLGDVVARRAPRPVTPALILEHTARMYGLSIDEITGSSRRRPLVNARQIAMYVIRELTDLSYPAIAREFGGRDHTTVIHAVEKIRNLMGERRQIYEQVTTLIDEIRGGDD
jgi:chromosomal replication initiator protein